MELIDFSKTCSCRSRNGQQIAEHIPVMQFYQEEGWEPSRLSSTSHRMRRSEGWKSNLSIKRVCKFAWPLLPHTSQFSHSPHVDVCNSCDEFIVGENTEENELYNFIQSRADDPFWPDGALCLWSHWVTCILDVALCCMCFQNWWRYCAHGVLLHSVSFTGAIQPFLKLHKLSQRCN